MVAQLELILVSVDDLTTLVTDNHSELYLNTYEPFHLLKPNPDPTN